MSKLKPYKYQEEGIEKTLAMKRCINGDDMGLGKEQPYSEPVLTPDGWVKMADLNIGDAVTAADGTAAVVTGIFEQGRKDVYRVSFSDGTYVRCGLHHLWNVRTPNDRYRHGDDYYRTMELQDIMSNYRVRVYDKRYPDAERWNYTYSIPLCKPVEYSQKRKLPLHPFVVGVLIGDGCLSGKRRLPIVCKPNDSLRHRVERSLNNGDRVSDFRSDGMTFSILSGEDGINHTAEAITQLDLWRKSKEKFIPICYLYASIAERRELLEGLLATDGHKIKEDVWEYSTASPWLARDFIQLARSLGYIVRRIDRESYYEKGGKRFPSSRIYVYGPKSRKIKSIVKIEKEVEQEPQRCILVDHPDHLYITREFAVTHNTAQSIVSVERAGATPCLVICPASLKINWQREVEKFTELRPLILTDSIRSTFPYFIGKMNLYDVVIVNYESLKKYFVVRAEKGAKLKDIVFQDVIRLFRSVIIDECHRCKNPATATARYVMGICQGKEYVVGLTGTPVVNDTMDLATQLCILGRIGDFGGYKEFVLRYGEGKRLGELNEVLHTTCYFRRAKKEVLTDLPDLTRSKVITELSNQEEYDLLESDLKAWLLEYKGLDDAEARKKLRMKALVTFMNLRKLAGEGKVEAAVSFIADASEPIVVFCEHHDIVDALVKELPDAVCVTGRQNAVQKQAAIDAFQNGSRRVIICSIKAAGVGLTLTAASNVLFVNLPWTMADLSQCESRCHRNGQKNAVNSWILIGNRGERGTIDSYLYSLIMKKGSMANRITGAEDDALKDEKYFDELAAMFLDDVKEGL